MWSTSWAQPTMVNQGATLPVGGYTACGIPVVRSASGDGNGIPLPFVSVKKNFQGSVKFPFLLIALHFLVTP